MSKDKLFKLTLESFSRADQAGFSDIVRYLFLGNNFFLQADIVAVEHIRIHIKYVITFNSIGSKVKEEL